MVPQSDGEALREVIYKRYTILECIGDSRKTIPEIVTDSQKSRTTIDRSIKSLESHQLIRELEGRQYELTNKGKLVRDEVKDYNAFIDSLAGTTDLICSLNDVEQIPRDVFRDAEYRIADPKAPETCLQYISDILKSATHFQATSTVAHTYLIDIICSTISKNNTKTEITAEKDIIESLAQIRKDNLKRIASDDSVDFFSVDKPIPYTGWVIDTPSREVGVLILHSGGGIKGVVMNDSQQTIDWLRKFCDRYQSDGTLITESSIQDL
ncbi:helix-turn-helix transcriptional regulator [Halorubrum sp. FL23]|jgi:predicted transcriptional regulator|uniref:helix-turn-helix transcriptional regulator n=1 Tax=Halorubrum sp. FL23 TaxID=3458704 RepID=UPI0040336025